MASAQVLPQANASRNKVHLEAGKRRLEEFRKKKKADDLAKKAASTGQLNTAEIGLHEKQPLEIERVAADSSGAGTSDEVGGAVIDLSGIVINNDNNRIEIVQDNELVQKKTKDQELNRYNALESAGPPNANYSHQTNEKNGDYNIFSGASGRLAYEVATDQSIALRPLAIQDIDSNSSQSSHHGLKEVQSKDNDSPVTNSESSYEVGQNMQNVLKSNNTMISDTGERKPSSSIGGLPIVNDTPLWPSESRSTGFSFDVRSSSNHVPLYPSTADTNTRRTRPSFLDSISIPRVPSASDQSFTKTERMESFSKLRTQNVDVEHSMKSSTSAGNVDDLYRHSVNGNSVEWKNDFYSQKQDEDFAALEQHIEDLTQEKFSLQRALEASRTLAESLAAENSTLTDSYNQQGSVVNLLKSDMEKLQEEIKVQLVELESLKIEYSNVLLECNAADERAKLLASEVIGLEEKTLRLRSSELKLERLLENSQAEISSFKKKMSSLEKDRQDLQSTIEALQEEKKLLQEKLWKASANGKFIDVSKSRPSKKDVSTSTEDLGRGDSTDATPDTSFQEMHSTAPHLGSNTSSSSLLPEDRQFILEVSSWNIPHDQMRMIQNINTLISELALEKEGLMQALSTESSQSSKLKELNMELSRKLEAQTQKLELLTAQSMAHESVPARRQEDPQTMHDNAAYADEGDEVVERVLGWIMKLFPGGPSRRRTSRLL
ncbi:protein BLISTER isoform X2 [Cornus florida]|uniref:protein BLISTER isoform X2 n=1 Tax=Cornus florida TaxID=4283 RepID=UPI002899B853|nr:protein BLISTER isoform X2 [Cornus florida]